MLTNKAPNVYKCCYGRDLKLNKDGRIGNKINSSQFLKNNNYRNIDNENNNQTLLNISSKLSSTF